MAEDTVRQCAANLMGAFHTMMRTVGPEMRKRSPEVLSIQQFRAIKTIEHHKGASLSEIAEHLGANLSAASKLVDGLVERGFVRRETAENDRRKVVLAITDTAQQAVESLDQEAVSCLADRISTLSPGECAMLNLAMDLLRSALAIGQSAAGRQPAQSGDKQI